jgi:REP element-mobilizing transposase RayT
MNKYNPNKTGKHKELHQRKSIRLKGYDYSQAGLYFITICVQNRECLFGKIANKKMNLNDAGKMVKNEWLELPKRFQNIQLHEYTVMPNHFHAILEIIPVGATLVVAQNDVDDHTQNNVTNSKNGQPQNGQPQGIAPTDKTVGDMVGAFESIVTVEYIRGVNNNNWQPFDGKLWQRNYWEHIIRNENEYNRIAQYIFDNPIKWKNDKLNGGDGNIVMEPQAEYNSEI